MVDVAVLIFAEAVHADLSKCSAKQRAVSVYGCGK